LQPGKYLILVRHSLPQIEPGVPAREWHLSADGVQRAGQLAKELTRYQPGSIFTSFEPKAVETAHIIAEQLDLPTEIKEGLQEHARPGKDYLSQEAFEDNIKRFFDSPAELVMGLETADQAYLRFNNAIAGILSANPNQTFVVVTHGTVMSAYIARRTGCSAFTFWKALGLPAYAILSPPDLDLLVAVENFA
jgi:broad specificity phosphatase PhoE